MLQQLPRLLHSLLLLLLLQEELLLLLLLLVLQLVAQLRLCRVKLHLGKASVVLQLVRLGRACLEEGGHGRRQGCR